MPTNPAHVGQRIQRLRVANGYNQAQLASTAEIPSGVMSMIEHGRHQLEDTTLRRLAAALGCSIEYLTIPLQQSVSTKPWLRAYADASKKAVDRYVADSEIAVEVFDLLRLKQIPESLPHFDEDANDEDAIETFAEEVRHAASLNDGDVVNNCIRRAERLGVIVLPMHDELGRHMGLSQRINSTPVIRVSRPHLSDDGTLTPSGDRQRFTVAHELGHLALHATTPPPATADQARLIEQQAHRFAGAFLAPADPLLADLDAAGGRVTLSTLTELKMTWGVSIKMLVVRLRQLGRIDDHHSRSLYKQISARKWNKAEPVPVGHESALWLAKSLQRKGESNSTVAQSIGLDRHYLEDWQRWTASHAYESPLPAGVTRLPTSSQRR